MKRILALMVLFLLVLTAWLLLARQKSSVHYHAGFLVYIDGVVQNYSDFRYMNITPCGDHDSAKTAEEEQIEKAHLHDGVGDVVHVHRTGALWRDLFTNIRVTLPEGKPVTGMRNGETIAAILDQPIVADQRVIIAVGDTTTIDWQKTVSLEHMKEVEARSETCGS